jgi:hypothetical protein
VHKRNAIVTVAALGTMLFAASMLGAASADAATAAPAAPSPQPPSSCSAVYFDIELGQGVDVFCNQAPATYQVIAQCNNGAEFWSSVGTVSVANSAPSIALCRGELLAPAQIISYYVIE